MHMKQSKTRKDNLKQIHTTLLLCLSSQWKNKGYIPCRAYANAKKNKDGEKQNESEEHDRMQPFLKDHKFTRPLT